MVLNMIINGTIKIFKIEAPKHTYINETKMTTKWMWPRGERDDTMMKSIKHAPLSMMMLMECQMETVGCRMGEGKIEVNIYIYGRALILKIMFIIVGGPIVI